MTDSDNGEWAEQLSKRALTILLAGLLVVALARGVTSQSIAPTRRTDAALCLASAVGTTLAIASVNPALPAGVVAAVCHCGRLLQPRPHAAPLHGG